MYYFVLFLEKIYNKNIIYDKHNKIVKTVYDILEKSKIKTLINFEI